MRSSRFRRGGRSRAKQWPGELAEWRIASHPKAALKEIEDAVFEAMQKLQARALSQVSTPAQRANLATQASDGRPTCPTCGGQLDQGLALGLAGQTVTPGIIDQRGAVQASVNRVHQGNAERRHRANGSLAHFW
jgi:hypothetical protein